MKINIADIIKEQGATKWVSVSKENIELPRQFNSMELSGPVTLEGQLESDNGSIYLIGTLTAQLKTICDRCTCDCIYNIKSEVTEDFGKLVDRFAIDLEPIIDENFIISLPMKTLCKEECQGICFKCGEDLNKGSCNCDREVLDPRLEKLGLIFDNVEQGKDNEEV